jgi:transposase-like protein
MIVEREDTQFRVVGQGISSGWWEDTPSNRKAVVVFLRTLQDDRGKALFTHQEVALVLGSPNRQASDEHLQQFRDSGGDLLRYLRRKRKVDGQVVEAVAQELGEDLWVSLEELAIRVNGRLGRADLTVGNMASALDQVSGRVVRRLYQQVVVRGVGHYRESYVVDRLFGLVLASMEGEGQAGSWEGGVIESLECGTEAIGEVGLEEVEEVRDRDRKAQETLLEAQEAITPEGLKEVWERRLGWMLWSLLLYRHGLSLSVIGGWLGVDKSTVCRWLSEVASFGWDWLVCLQVGFSGRVSVDEKWIKIGGVCWYVFAAVDCVSGYPLHIALYPSNSGVYCKLFLLELKRVGYIPKVIVTDGWDGYVQAIRAVFPHAEHLLCRFHVLKAFYRRLRQVGVWDEQVWSLVGKVFQTSDKRTVHRRVKRLGLLLEGMGVGEVLVGFLSKLPKVLPAVGSTWRPSTANGVERFFGALDRLYGIKGPFVDVDSATKHIRLFMLCYVFELGARGQACPLENAGVDVGKLPLYHLFNRPNVRMLHQRMAPLYREAA